MSYDIDGDGFVSQEDLKIGKTIDVNNDGVIQDNEKQMGVVKMARVRFTLRRHTVGVAPCTTCSSSRRLV